MVKAEYSQYLSSLDVEEGATVTISDFPSYETIKQIDGEEKQKLALLIQLSDGRVKPWLANQTTIKRLIEAWGDDCDQWVKRQIKIRKMRQMVRGEERDVLYGSPLVETLPTSDQTKQTPEGQEARCPYCNDFRATDVRELASHIEGCPAVDQQSTPSSQPTSV